MLEDVELFLDEIRQLFHQEDRNLSNLKKPIEREKIKVNQEIEHIKKEMIHNIDDLKISIYAELDNIFKNYLETYANLNGEIVGTKKMKQEISMDINRRFKFFLPKYNQKT
jgi:hypothetical protein